MEILFSLISIFYAFRGLQIAVIVAQNWVKLRGPNFTPQAKSLAGQASFFLAVPIGVFVHEFGHAFFVRLFGGSIIEFGYRVFWGFVEHRGSYTAGQSWLISLAGTLGSLLFGLFIWLALKNDASPTFRYFGLRAFRFQIFFSLVYYPLFTLMGFYGDWRTIYNFDTTPLLSGATAVVHAGLLLWFWWADRNGFFEMGAFASAEAKEKITALEERAASSPYDTELKLLLISTYRKGGMDNKARKLAQAFIKENPNSGEGHLELALLAEAGKREVPAKARDHAVRAISLGLNKAEASAHAHHIIGRYNLGVNKLQEAVDHFSQALTAGKSPLNLDLQIDLLYHRGLAYRRKQQYNPAFEDIQQAIHLASQGNRKQALQFLKTELETIAQHAGRSPDQFMNPPNP